MSDWFMENKLRIDDELKIKIDGHAGLNGNKEIANIVLKYLNKNKLIKTI
jgi:hypothetical protein